MPKKYHIDVQFAPNRYPTIGRSGIVDWGEGCLKCARCVKYDCVYDVYRNRSFSTDILGDTIDELCKSCFRCVQGCPKRLIHKTLNPEWESLGDDVYTPEIISATWEQAQSGKIPVSGAGYGGSFSGPGFDSMWTDMSEIVRPTRDGIHGREYISTVIDIGRRPSRLIFDELGQLISEPLPSIRVPIPILFDAFPFGSISPAVLRGVAAAAAALDTLMWVPPAYVPELSKFAPYLVPLLNEGRYDYEWIPAHRMVEIPDAKDAVEIMTALKRRRPDMLVSVRIPAVSYEHNVAKVLDYTRAGFDLIHYVADERGYEPGLQNGLHLKDMTKEVQAALLHEGLRDEITFMVSGGIAMAEHVIKSMLCGANLVGVDVPLLVALECRVCRNCRDGGECPVGIAKVDSKWASRRIINLIGAWHNQLLEMMGAMGIREARRLRGEQGRVLFREDLENDTFAQLFARPNS
ncbi:MAG TPA: glutamate synthase-related protein [Desulfomonilaceae bacterium]|nr:glutamate synthase-related protein [Desulfomonilaceae bacterium]